MQKITLALLTGLLAVSPLNAQAQVDEEIAPGAREAAAETVAEAVEAVVALPLPVSMNPSGSAPSPKSGFWQIIKVADYPIEAWQNDEEGTVRYRLIVDEEGQVSSCSVTESSRSHSLDEATCKLISGRARFDPALDGDGKPIVGTYDGRHSWRKRESEMPDFAVRFDFVNTVSGEAIDCKVEILRGEMPDGLKRQLDRAEERGECRAMTGRTGVPYRDENGVPVEKRVSVTIDIALEDVA